MQQNLLLIAENAEAKMSRGEKITARDQFALEYVAVHQYWDKHCFTFAKAVEGWILNERKVFRKKLEKFYPYD